PRSIHDVPDDLLRQILLRLDSPLWLLRAASACRQFRCAVASADSGRAFLRLASSLHPPVVIRHYHNRWHHNCSSSVRPIAFVPSPSSPLAPPIDVTDWEVADCHGGLVVLCDRQNSPPNLSVCDPLTRRYQGIPHPPGKRAGFVVALLDGDGKISISNFRVLYYCFHGVCVFSAADGGDGWRFLRPPSAGSNYMGHVAGRVDGSIYLDSLTGNVRVLDNVSLELSEVCLPFGIDKSKAPWRSAFTVVHGAGANPTWPPSTWIIHVHGEELEFFRRVRGGIGGEWVLEHSIPKLSEVARGLQAGCPEKRLERTVVHVIAVGTGIAVLSARNHCRWRWLFSVNMDTKELQVVRQQKAYGGTEERTFTYTLPWPQFLRACPS
uniref:F-box domain-containing protein n=1 Tax=Setaria italica TaxID=4555 RepID=K3ZDQ1_SETIT